MRSVVEPRLLAGPRRYTRAQVAELSQTPPAVVRRLWVSLGFPVNPDDEAVDYIDADIEALQAFRGLNFAVSDNPETERLQTAAARTIGQARGSGWPSRSALPGAGSPVSLDRRLCYNRLHSHVLRRG
jgi:adenylate cyclase